MQMPRIKPLKPYPRRRLSRHIFSVKFLVNWYLLILPHKRRFLGHPVQLAVHVLRGNREAGMAQQRARQVQRHAGDYCGAGAGVAQPVLRREAQPLYPDRLCRLGTGPSARRGAAGRRGWFAGARHRPYRRGCRPAVRSRCIDDPGRVHHLQAARAGQLQIEVVRLADEIRPGRYMVPGCPAAHARSDRLAGHAPSLGQRHFAVLAALAHHVQHSAAIALLRRRHPLQLIAPRGGQLRDPQARREQEAPHEGGTPPVPSPQLERGQFLQHGLERRCDESQVCLHEAADALPLALADAWDAGLPAPRHASG